MKLMVVGYFASEQYEAATVAALRRRGHDVREFNVWKYWRHDVVGRAIRRTAPRVWWRRFNEDLLQAAIETKPDAMYFRRCVEVRPDVLRDIRRRTGAVLVSYMNDDPLGFRRGHSMWRAFVEAIPEYDIHFVFREANVTEFYALGAKQCRVLLPYFVPDLHRRVDVSDEDVERYGCDAIFIGHRVDDHRVRYVRALVDAGLRVKVFGPGWGGRSGSRHLGISAGPPMHGDQYVRAINAAHACLCFYDHLNRDSITTRNMEIPACGSVLVAERSTLATAVHREGVEALFFDSPEELVATVRHLRDAPRVREAIGRAGLAWAARGEHTIGRRVESLIDAIERVRASTPAYGRTSVLPRGSVDPASVQGDADC